jgi:hypothetical protein
MRLHLYDACCRDWPDRQIEALINQQHVKEKIMKTFVIRRRNAWKSAEDLELTASRSAKIGNEDMPDQVRWIRSYVVKEDDGTLGTVCIYQAISPEAIRDHAGRVGMPANEITEVADTVIVRDDPIAKAA